MKLNTTSYVHKKIRLLCFQLQQITEMRLITDLNANFNEIQFVGKLSYIIIKYKRKACFALGHHITKVEWQTIQDIMLYLDWLETGKKYQKKCYKNVTILKKSRQRKKTRVECKQVKQKSI